MADGLVEEFTSSLSGLGVTHSHVGIDDLGAVVTDVAQTPVVGAELPWDGASLADLDSPEVNLAPSLADLRAARSGVTPAALGIADYGSVVLRTDADATTEHASLFVDTHVAVVRESDLHPGMASALAEIGPLAREEDASAIVATGPSATADMGALVRGAHGPEEVHVVVLEGR